MACPPPRGSGGTGQQGALACPPRGLVREFLRDDGAFVPRASPPQPLAGTPRRLGTALGTTAQPQREGGSLYAMSRVFFYRGNGLGQELVGRWGCWSIPVRCSRRIWGWNGWARSDSNRRPGGYEPLALAAKLRAPEARERRLHLTVTDALRGRKVPPSGRIGWAEAPPRGIPGGQE